MKRKKKNQRLSLNKLTVANLGRTELAWIRGGEEATETSCKESCTTNATNTEMASLDNKVCDTGKYTQSICM